MKHARIALAIASLALIAAAHAPTEPEPGIYPLGEGMYLIVCDGAEIDPSGHVCKIIIGDTDARCAISIITDQDGVVQAAKCSAKPQCKTRQCVQVVHGYQNGNPQVGCHCIVTAGEPLWMFQRRPPSKPKPSSAATSCTLCATATA